MKVKILTQSHTALDCIVHIAEQVSLSFIKSMVFVHSITQLKYQSSLYFTSNKQETQTSHNGVSLQLLWLKPLV